MRLTHGRPDVPDAHPTAWALRLFRLQPALQLAKFTFFDVGHARPYFEDSDDDDRAATRAQARRILAALAPGTGAAALAVDRRALDLLHGSEELSGLRDVVRAGRCIVAAPPSHGALPPAGHEEELLTQVLEQEDRLSEVLGAPAEALVLPGLGPPPPGFELPPASAIRSVLLTERPPPAWAATHPLLVRREPLPVPPSALPADDPGRLLAEDARSALYALRPAARQCGARGDPAVLQDWLRLADETSFAGLLRPPAGAPAASPAAPGPYERYLSYMNVLADLARRLSSPETQA